ncbi:hypothetical protein SpCBS45565_g00784 [Spizellomyces sp. 'palustris']|nr:hypothetical protein SpCBS45565_g00784 [Spizellomyces sp. 'palustris']
MLADIEKPICPAGLTFEELLDRQLKIDDTNPCSNPVQHRSPLKANSTPRSSPREQRTEDGNPAVEKAIENDDADVILETQVLTPARLANRRRWHQIQRSAVDQRDEFEELERLILGGSTSDEEEERASTGPADEMEHDAEMEADSVGRRVEGRGYGSPKSSAEDLSRTNHPRTTSTNGNLIADYGVHPTYRFRGRDNSSQDKPLITEEDEPKNWREVTSPMASSKRFLSQAFSEGEQPGSLDHVPESTHPANGVDTPIADASDIGAQASEGDSSSTGIGPSRLLYSLFPGLRPKLNKPAEDPGKLGDEASDGLPKASASTIEDELKQKLQTLQQELEKFKRAEDLTRRGSRESEQAIKILDAEKKSFEKYKQEEIEKINQMREDTLRDLKRERKIWEKQRKAAEILPTKRERQDVELLRKQIETLQASFKEKESRMTLAQDRLKRRVEDLTRRNMELQEEVKVLEQERAAYVERNQTCLETVHRPPVYAKHQPVIIKHVKGAESTPTNGWTSREEEPIGNSGPSPSSTTQSISAVTKKRVSRRSISNSVKSRAAVAELDALEKRLSFSGCVEQRTTSDGKLERVYANGIKLVRYSNGTLKEVHPDDELIVIHFTNGDSKTVFADGRIVYWYTEQRTLHTTYKDGLQVYEFSNGQVEKHYPDGTNEIVFADKTVKYIFTNGEEESLFPDGRIQRVEENGKKTWEYPNGIKEVYLNGVRTKYYGDGLVKISNPDGTEEMRWSDGRVKVRDADGRVAYDNKVME